MGQRRQGQPERASAHLPCAPPSTRGSWLTLLPHLAKDTVTSWEEGLSLEQLSHYAAHRPDVHCWGRRLHQSTLPKEPFRESGCCPDCAQGALRCTQAPRQQTPYSSKYNAGEGEELAQDPWRLDPLRSIFECLPAKTGHTPPPRGLGSWPCTHRPQSPGPGVITAAHPGPTLHTCPAGRCHLSGCSASSSA